jgi:hypothetical protein
MMIDWEETWAIANEQERDALIVLVDDAYSMGEIDSDLRRALIRQLQSMRLDHTAPVAFAKIRKELTL